MKVVVERLKGLYIKINIKKSQFSLHSSVLLEPGNCYLGRSLMKASSLISVLPRHFCTAESVSMLQIRVFKMTGNFSSERSKDDYEEGS